jgi:hypothetical protein
LFLGLEMAPILLAKCGTPDHVPVFDKRWEMARKPSVRPRNNARALLMEVAQGR